MGGSANVRFTVRNFKICLNAAYRFSAGFGH
jgi:hypothetical protein